MIKEACFFFGLNIERNCSGWVELRWAELWLKSKFNSVLAMVTSRYYRHTHSKLEFQQQRDTYFMSYLQIFVRCIWFCFLVFCSFLWQKRAIWTLWREMKQTKQSGHIINLIMALILFKQQTSVASMEIIIAHKSKIFAAFAPINFDVEDKYWSALISLSKYDGIQTTSKTSCRPWQPKQSLLYGKMVKIQISYTWY